MVTALELENFKGIAARQRVDFAPLTLLFGANSAGKSTVLQALLYLHEILERGTADVDRTELGGGVIELGGFARLVHRHEGDRAIVLRAEFATPDKLERFGRDVTDFPFPDLDDGVESAWLELTIRFRTTAAFRGPLVERAVIGVGQDVEPLVWLWTGATLREVEPLFALVNLGHSLIAESAHQLGDSWAQIALPFELLQVLGGSFEADHGEAAGSHAGLWNLSGFDPDSLTCFAISRSRLSALPPIEEPLSLIEFEVEPEDPNHDRLQEKIDRLGYKEALQATQDELRARERAMGHMRTFLEMVVLGTTAQLAASLRDAIYIGPLRTVPPRGFLYERTGRIASWADGLAAWDRLLADSILVEETNRWLHRLDAGCRVKVQQFFDSSAAAEELSDGHVDKTVRRLLLDTGAGSLVLPSEVGAGVSQVIPVVVAALEGRSGLFLVEQPEIHIHPAMQVGLGDLFIDAATRDRGRRTMLVETHSEHLILRILRRIRETTEKELRDGEPGFSADKLSVLYVESGSDGVRIRRLQVDERGEFKDRWPKGFFAERMEELL